HDGCLARGPEGFAKIARRSASGMNSEQGSCAGDGKSNLPTLDRLDQSRTGHVSEALEVGKSCMIQGLHDGETGGHRHWTGRESPALRDCRLLLICVEHLHHASAARDRADGESTANDLPQCIEIRLEPIASESLAPHRL